jgi:hypothetical protein
MKLRSITAAGKKDQVSDVDRGDIGQAEGMGIGQQCGSARVCGG